ncbi:DUF6879 family protein [Streptomyces sp. NPDC003717]|uniref:DUF6879 family protein n=1 Tax=Streptomyces sp. NPDC003717 TaxID=3154276 RepID=UPI0033AEC3B8
MLLDGDGWRTMLRGFQTEAWRLETLLQYLVPQEAEELEAFRTGNHVDPHAYSSAYTEDLERLRGEGKSKGRVHVLNRPLSEYLRFESTVVLMHYEGDGTQTSRELYEGDPAPFVEWQRIAVSRLSRSARRLNRPLAR